MDKVRSPRNQTLALTQQERELFHSRVVTPIADESFLTFEEIVNRTLCDNLFSLVNRLPEAIVDLLILDPPYNLDKNFHGAQFNHIDDQSYQAYLESWFVPLLRVLKPNASVYLCGDWKGTLGLYNVMQKYTQLRNRITWQREKGRGAQHNWKNSTEDIWFGTLGQEFYFNVDAVKIRRKVLAPYTHDGLPKDWEETKEGRFRLTHPGNFWDDLSVPYWSMPENTDHPTQKPEKLIARLILASCPPGGVVLDPFLGSGTTSVVSKKLGRQYIGIEQNPEYCLWAEKRLDRASSEARIQGYEDGVFWERNARHK